MTKTMAWLLLLCSFAAPAAGQARDGHRTVATFPIPSAGDVVKFDSGLKRIYAACASGAIVVIQEDDPDHFRKLEDFRVEPKVHSLAVDAETHRVYAPEEEEGGHPAVWILIAIARGTSAATALPGNRIWRHDAQHWFPVEILQGEIHQVRSRIDADRVGVGH
jgi:hypothetical protein